MPSFYRPLVVRKFGQHRRDDAANDSPAARFARPIVEACARFVQTQLTPLNEKLATLETENGELRHQLQRHATHLAKGVAVMSADRDDDSNEPMFSSLEDFFAVAGWDVVTQRSIRRDMQATARAKGAQDVADAYASLLQRVSAR
jgi:hypothetical protein